MSRSPDVIATTLGYQRYILTAGDWTEEGFRRAFRDQHGPDGDDPMEGLDVRVESTLRQLRDSAPFYVMPDISAFLRSVAPSLPDSASFTYDLFPVGNGFVYLDGVWPTEQGPLRALSWDCFSTAEDPRPPDMDGFTATAWIETPPDGFPGAAQCVGSIPATLGAVLGNPTGIRPLYALLSFIREKIFVESRLRPQARHQRLVAPYTEPPEVRVILLRAKKARPPGEGTRDMEWGFRFIQSGHWGIRLHGSGAYRVPVVQWISPGIKGTPGTPLRVSAKTLRAVIR